MVLGASDKEMLEIFELAATKSESFATKFAVLPLTCILTTLLLLARVPALVVVASVTFKL